jgi:hypothetical protein
MNTLSLSTISSMVSTHLRGGKLAVEAAELSAVVEQAAKVAKCHGAARANVISKLARMVCACSPVAAYNAIVAMAKDGVLADVQRAAFAMDRTVTRAKGAWGETHQAKLIRATRAGVKVRNRELAESVFTDNVNPKFLNTLALWGETDALLERSAWNATGFGRGRDVEPSAVIIRTSSDGKLQNTADNMGAVTFTKHDDPDFVLEALAHMGLDPAKAFEFLEEIKTKGVVTVQSDSNVAGETGDISTHNAMGGFDEADQWLRANQGQVQETDVLYHRPKMSADIRGLLEDPAVMKDLMARGAGVWADGLPAMVKASRGQEALSAKLFDEDGMPVGGRKAVRKTLTSLALWEMQATREVRMAVSNDTGSLTASGKYRPGETDTIVTVAERARLQYLEATSGTTVTSDIERVQASYEFWCVQIPEMRESYLNHAIKAHHLMSMSLMESGMDIPLDSVAFDQVSMALVDLPSEIPAGLVVKPVTNGVVHMRDDSGRLLFWVTPFNACWTPEGEMTEDGKAWARFVLDQRAAVREVDAHEAGMVDSINILDSLTK